MEFEWEFFENLDELVYVADMETYELVYMNAKTREVLGCQGHDMYCGKPCYQVLQGFDSQCPFLYQPASPAGRILLLGL